MISTVMSDMISTVRSGMISTVMSGMISTVRSGMISTVRSGLISIVRSGMITIVWSGMISTVMSGKIMIQEVTVVWWTSVARLLRKDAVWVRRSATLYLSRSVNTLPNPAAGLSARRPARAILSEDADMPPNQSFM